jgi:GNAT superfamily N-acetyltransferase
LIRQATVEDIDLVSDLIKSFINSLPEYGLSFDSDKLFDMFTDGTHVCLIDDEGNGFIAGKVFEEVTSHKKYLMEMAWYVLPEHRGIGVDLLKAFEDYGRNNGIETVVMVAINNGMYDIVSRFYKQNGYSLMETHFMRRL